MIESVVSAFRGFRSTCLDFGVPAANITILATEATRTPPNSKEFLGEIKEKVGWEVGLLAKEEEGRVGAMGIASSFEEVDGLVMDLGGKHYLFIEYLRFSFISRALLMYVHF